MNIRNNNKINFNTNLQKPKFNTDFDKENKENNKPVAKLQPVNLNIEPKAADSNDYELKFINLQGETKKLKETNLQLQNKVSELNQKYTNVMKDYSEVYNNYMVLQQDHKQLQSKYNKSKKVNSELNIRLKTYERLDGIQKKTIEENEQAITQAQQQLQKNTNEKTSVAISKFYDFMTAYKFKNMHSNSGIGFFLGDHGGTGLTVATDFEASITNELQNKQSIAELLDYIEDQVKKASETKRLTGNFKPGSFKTYLLAYHRFLTQLNSDNGIANVNVNTYVNRYKNTTPEKIQQKFEETFKLKDNQELLNNVRFAS